MEDRETWMWGIAFLLLVYFLHAGAGAAAPGGFGTTIAYPLGVTGPLNPFTNSNVGACG